MELSQSKSQRDHGSIFSCRSECAAANSTTPRLTCMPFCHVFKSHYSLLLYPLVLALIALPAYWVYSTFIEPRLFPKKKVIKKRSASTSVVAKSPTPRPSTPSDPSEWIPEHHLKTRRTVSGRNLVNKGTGGVTPAFTSGDETSGNESQTPRRSARANKGRKAA